MKYRIVHDGSTWKPYCIERNFWFFFWETIYPDNSSHYDTIEAAEKALKEYHEESIRKKTVVKISYLRH